MGAVELLMVWARRLDCVPFHDEEDVPGLSRGPRQKRASIFEVKGIVSL